MYSAAIGFCNHNRNLSRCFFIDSKHGLGVLLIYKRLFVNMLHFISFLSALQSLDFRAATFTLLAQNVAQINMERKESV